MRLSDGGFLSVYVHDNTELPQEQSTDIYWVRSSGAAWSVPSPVVGGDSRYEANPRLATDGEGRVICVWQRIRDNALSMPFLEDEDDVKAFLSLFEIVYTVLVVWIHP